MKIILPLIFLCIAGCTTATTKAIEDRDSNSLVCFNIDAATFLSLVTASTSIRGVHLPDGITYTHKELIEILNACFQDDNPLVREMLLLLQTREQVKLHSINSGIFKV